MDLVITDELVVDMKKVYMEDLSYMIANQFLVYKKHLDISDFNYIHIVKSASDQMYLSKAELGKVEKESKKILKEHHGIIVIKDNPIIIKYLH